MATVSRPQADQLVITLTAQDQAVVDQVLAANPMFFSELIEQVLAKKRIAMTRVERDRVASKYRNLDQADRAVVDAILNKGNP